MTVVPPCDQLLCIVEVKRVSATGDDDGEQSLRACVREIAVPLWQLPKAPATTGLDLPEACNQGSKTLKLDALAAGDESIADIVILK